MSTCLARVPKSARLVAALLALAPLGLGFQEPQVKPEKPAPPTAAERFAKARDLAAHENTRVLLVWTSSEGDVSKTLGEILTRHRQLARLIRYEFEMVRVSGDPGSKDANLAKRLGVDLTGGLPAITIFDGKGKLLAHHAAQVWIGDGKLDPALVISTLERLKAAPQDAEQVLKRALAASAKKDRNVLVHLGAPW